MTINIANLDSLNNKIYNILRKFNHIQKYK